MKSVLVLLFILFLSFAAADERAVTPEQQAAISGETDEIPEAKPTRPANLPDLTKGELIPPGKNGPPTWSWGPTGIVGTMNARWAGDQIEVQSTRPGSPAEGKFQWGDVIVGINGKPFIAGEHLGYRFGKAIIEAEKEENGGKMTFQVWRDLNFLKRRGKKDLRSLDLDDVFAEARDDDSLYEWKDEEARTYEAQGFLDYPIKPSTHEVEITLRTMPSYSDTAPYDCPKSQQILEDAWKVLEKKFVAEPGKPRSGRGGVLEAMALLASGKPEHQELVHKWVRSEHSPWRPPTEKIGAKFEPGYRGYNGYQTWHYGFNGLYCALYYDATGDDFVLPALRKFAIEAAMGQSSHGSWGHTFSFPSFNGGEMNRMCPGYGALNAAGNRCYFLITLAQKMGIEHPEIDKAVERATRFFGSYVDQGAIPYGDHGAAATDDSNGKNTGVAFSLKLLGDNHGAKYFAMMSSHCSFTRRGGHGHDYHGNWSFWAANLCGPEVRALAERNMRWRRTLCRQHDGSFVYHSPTYGSIGGGLRNPTATAVMTYSVPFKQLLITGKDSDESLYPNEREMKQLLASARGQMNDEWLLEKAGKPWPERSTNELFELLDIFKPKARGQVAKELGKRYQAGETEIAARLEKLLTHEEPRYRDGALRGLQECGTDAALQVLSKMSPLLGDPNDFIRITATRVIGKISDDEQSQLAMLRATVAEPDAIGPNSVRNATQTALFSKDTELANNPFEAGVDTELVSEALEKLITLDPVGGRGFVSSRIDVWSKDTVVRMAGPLTFAAEEEQIADQMFANRSKPAQEMLLHHGYREGVLASAHRLRKQAAIPRDIRAKVGFKRGLVDAEAIEKHKGVYEELLGAFQTVLLDDPLETVMIQKGKDKVPVNLSSLMKVVSEDKAPANLPSIEGHVEEAFRTELKSLTESSDQIQHCRAELKNPERKNYFRQMAAMTYLAENLGSEALQDLSPYLDHDYFRLREHSRELAIELVRAGGEAVLAELFEKSTDPRVSAGILHVFSRTGGDVAARLSMEGLESDEAEVRSAALQALYTLSGSDAFPVIMGHFESAKDREDFRGWELALTSRLEDPENAARVRDAVIAILPKVSGESEKRSRCYYILGQIGDEASLAFLKEASTVEEITEFEEIVAALSYSPNRKADEMLLRLAEESRKSAEIVGKESVRRMVAGDPEDSQRMDFAEPMLKLAMDRRLIKYLDRVHEARALRALMYCLENGVGEAAESLITNAEGLENLSSADSKVAGKAIRDVMEYIEVSHLRGGVEAHMKKEDNYPYWKGLQARAGRVLLKVHKPDAAPIPGFNDIDLDL